jgi:hypothetical protein
MCFRCIILCDFVSMVILEVVYYFGSNFCVVLLI